MQDAVCCSWCPRNRVHQGNTVRGVGKVIRVEGASAFNDHAVDRIRHSRRNGDGNCTGSSIHRQGCHEWVFNHDGLTSKGKVPGRLADCQSNGVTWAMTGRREGGVGTLGVAVSAQGDSVAVTVVGGTRTRGVHLHAERSIRNAAEPVATTPSSSGVFPPEEVFVTRTATHGRHGGGTRQVHNGTSIVHAAHSRVRSEGPTEGTVSDASVGGFEESSSIRGALRTAFKVDSNTPASSVAVAAERQAGDHVRAGGRGRRGARGVIIVEVDADRATVTSGIKVGRAVGEVETVHLVHVGTIGVGKEAFVNPELVSGGGTGVAHGAVVIAPSGAVVQNTGTCAARQGPFARSHFVFTQVLDWSVGFAVVRSSVLGSSAGAESDNGHASEDVSQHYFKFLDAKG